MPKFPLAPVTMMTLSLKSNTPETSQSHHTPHGMPAELISQGSQELIGEWFFLAGAKPALQRDRDDRRRHVQLDGLGHRPSALARIWNPGLHIAQILVIRKSSRRQVKQP